ncbi:hypothetical protein IAT38_004348 [Cryptococcus sp. DSM 104549]
MPMNRAFVKKWLPTEVLPIFGIVGLACGGATYYLWRLSQGSEVVWDRKGDWRPWDKVKHDENLKLITVNPEFWEKRRQAAATQNQRAVDAI